MKDNGFKLTAELLKKKLLKDVNKERCFNISGVPPLPEPGKSQLSLDRLSRILGDVC